MLKHNKENIQPSPIQKLLAVEHYILLITILQVTEHVKTIKNTSSQFTIKLSAVWTYLPLTRKRVGQDGNRAAILLPRRN